MSNLTYTKFQNFIHLNTIHTHFYSDHTNKQMTFLHDGLQLKDRIKKGHILLNQLDASAIEGNPFGLTPETEPKNVQLLIINDVAYELKVAKNDKTFMTHYLLFPFGFKTHENRDRFTREKDILTTRETEILILISKGLSMTKIAQKICISPHTVDSHRIKLCKKLNVRRTTELAVWAYKLGLLEESFIHAKAS